MDLIPPSEHHVLVFLVAFGVLLASARGLGELARRFGQPPVVGELAAGLLLGPSLFGRVAPDAEAWLFPDDEVQTAMLFTVAWLGVIFLLLATGFDTDLGLIRRLGRAAASVSTGSLLVPIAGGVVLGAVMPTVFLGTDDRVSFALFMGTALSISSLPVIAKMLTDMGYMRRDFGQLTIAAAMANDVVGWIALSVIAGLVSSGTISVGAVAGTLAGVGGFFLVAFTIGQRVVDFLLRGLRRRDVEETGRTTVLVVLAIAFAVATQWLGVEAVLGAFVAGILVGRSPYRDPRTLEAIETSAAAYLTPIFFATAGLRVDLGLLADPEVALWALGVVAVASLTKFAGALAGGSLVGLPRRESVALGIALNARGALEIVIASVGLSLGVLNSTSYTVVVLMAMTTSLMAPPLLRRALDNWPGTSEEQERLRTEELLASSLVIGADRLLLAGRGGPLSVLAAQVVDLGWPRTAAVTVLAAGPMVDLADLDPLAAVLHGREVTVEMRPDSVAVDAICEEAKLGYGAIILGLSAESVADGIPEWVSRVIAATNVPVVIIRRPKASERRTPWAFGRALVPVAGGPRAQVAQEVAFGISASIGTEIVLAHVRTPVHNGSGDGGRRVAFSVLAEATNQARTAGARIQTLERPAVSAPDEILNMAREVSADLVVLGAIRKAVGEEQYLGNTTTEVLANCECTVVAVVLPDRSS